MKNDELLNQILPILHSVKDDEEKLQQILDFLLEEIYEEPDDDVVEIPEKYRELVRKTAEAIDCGMVCFINPETLEMEDVPKSLLEERFFTEEDEEEEDDELDLQHQNWEKCISVEPPESHESFGIMENFIDEVDDKNLQRKLVNALERRHPFANFKNTIDNSDFREQWFAFKQKELEKYVWQNIEFEINPEK
jgi:hypothetical protein